MPVRQRSLHPSMSGYLCLSDVSSSDPGMGGSLSPYNNMKSLYFDDSLYENEMHYKLSQYLEKFPTSDDEEIISIKCETEKQYNDVLDKIYKAGLDKIRVCGTSKNPMEIIIEKDPRLKYRKFDEDKFLMKD